jgi:hypothetical protein
MIINIRRELVIFLCTIAVVSCNLSSTKSKDQDIVITVSPTSKPILTPKPGLQIEGHVTIQDGSGLAGVRIYRKFASYPGVWVATTDNTGYYRGEFLPIPGDEMVSMYAELEGYSITPKDNSLTWIQGSYYWRHYYGYEERVLDFVVGE